MSFFSRPSGAAVLTVSMVLCALFLGRSLWGYYTEAPWTRDARVSADIVRIAPEVSGTILQVEVKDNQYVNRGDVLFRVDPERFELARDQAQASYDAKRQSQKLAASTARRRQSLRDIGAESAERIEQAGSEASIADAEYRAALTSLKVAELNLKRSVILAPVDGYVTNLTVRPGDYAIAGESNVSILDSSTFRVTGYFQETQLAGMRTGDQAEVHLMSHRALPLTGHIESFGRGIADTNTATDTLGLPSVEPIFSWIRLAQRLPVRIHIDKVPEGVQLSVGMTASIYVKEGGIAAQAH